MWRFGGGGVWSLEFGCFMLDEMYLEMWVCVGNRIDL